MTRAAVLGLGNMGRAIAGRLLEGGVEVVVWNRSRGKADDLVAGGATEAASPGEAAGGADAVITSLRDDDAVRQVLLADPLATGDAAVVDCTTVSPDTSAALAGVYDRFVAAPVMGAPAAVRSGQALYALAGPGEVVDGLGPVWEALGGHTFRLGDDPAMAAVVKLANNSLLLSGLVALSEAVGVAQAAGLDDDTLVGLLGSSPLVAPGLRNRLEDMVRGDHDGWFAVPLGAKDLDLFAGLASSLGLDVALARRAADRYREAAAAGWADVDVAGVVELLRQRG